MLIVQACHIICMPLSVDAVRIELGGWPKWLVTWFHQVTTSCMLAIVGIRNGG